MNERERLGREIEKAIKRKGLTLREVSIATGISVSTVHRWSLGELPKHSISLFRLIRLLKLPHRVKEDHFCFSAD